MKKMKFTQKVALILLFACMFTLFAGCSIPATPTDPTITDPTTVTDPTDPTNTTDPSNSRSYVAECFACGMPINEYSINVKIDGDKFYLNETLYTATYTDNPGFSFGSVTDYKCAEGTYKTVYIFEKITTAEKCYILEAEGDTLAPDSPFRKSTLFDIDGVYYLIHGNYTGRIHYMKHTTAESLPEKDPSLSENATAMTAKPMAYMTGMTSDNSVAVWLDDDKLSMGGITYNITRSDNINISWEHIPNYNELLVAVADTEEIFDILKKIKSSEKCYILNRKESQSTMEIRVMYEIEGTYYFLICSESRTGFLPYTLYYANGI